MAGKSLTLRAIRAHDDAQVPPRLGLRILAVFVVLEALLLIALALIFPLRADAAPAKAEVSVSTSAGFGRLVFRFAEETETDIRLTNGILIITFKRPVEISVDRITIGAPDYVNAARRDPDGTAVRMALARKVTVNSMVAGERLFVDLLPDGWVGLPPGLPQEVVDELARRARDAEKNERRRLQLAQQVQQPPIRLRVGTQPTFTRYVFELPELVPVTTDRVKDKLTLLFDAPLRFDLADAQAALPPTIAAIEARQGDGTVSVRFDLNEGLEVRTFREDNNFIVDVLAVEAKERPVDLAAAAPDTRAALTPPASAAGPPPGQAAPRVGPGTAKEPGGTPRAAPAGPTAQGERNGGAAAQTVVPPTEVAPGPSKVAGEDATAPPALPLATASEAAERLPPQPAALPAGAVASKGPGDVAAEDGGTPPAPPSRRVVGEDAPRAPADAGAPVVVEVRRVGDALRLTFPFAAPTPAAVFRRADAVWLVFSASAPIDVSKLVTQAIGSVRSATVTRTREGQAVRIKVDRPKLTSVEADGPIWTVSIGDLVLEPTRPLAVYPMAAGLRRVSAVIPFETPHQLHRVSDPEVGDKLFVVTALGPPRGFLKARNFVEFHALASTHGIALQPVADDLNVALAPDKIVIERPPGLTLSSTSGKLAQLDTSDATRRGAGHEAFVFDTQVWGFDRQTNFLARQAELIRAAAAAPDIERSARRLELARFYLSRDMHVEAKAVLDVLLSEDRHKSDEAAALVLRAVAEIMMGRSADGLKDLSSPGVGDKFDASAWRALAYARQGKWVEAREGFRNLEAATAAMPIELQRVMFKEAVRTAIEVRDLAEAANLLDQLDMLGVPTELAPPVQVLKGRLAEALGRVADALVAYRSAADSRDRPAAAQGRLRAIVLGGALGQLNRGDAVNDLEGLSLTWRGDETEAETLHLLGRFYLEDRRYRDAFQVMRTALTVYPGSEVARRIQEDAAAAFDALFLDGAGDAMAPVEALSLFYDFRELTPVGRRGDEMIRRLADRLVSVDLLDQAAALLQHQVDHRLQGAARAQIAVRLAVIYLTGRKPERAIQALRATRTADLPNEVRGQRLLLEARALSDTGRHDLALELISNMEGREVERLRADVLWAARRWREAGERIEKLYGERWRDFAPLGEAERADILRAGLAYSLGEDALGLDRFRQKYAAKMGEGPDRRAFEVATSRAAVDSAEFAEIARKVSAVDTLESFLRDVRARFPQAGAAAPAQPAPGAARAF